jgi:serine/threonine-protein kinase
MRELVTGFTATGGEAQAPVDPTFDGWALQMALGQGPVCQSWLASRGTDKAVVRVLRQPFASQAQARSEWLRASWAANRFHHGRVVKVVGQGVAPSGAPMIVRGWARGESLDEALRRGPWDPVSALRLAEQILDALEMAHAHGIVHGGLSPTNVIVTPRRSVRLVDFAATPGLQARKAGDVDALASVRVGPFAPPERQRSSPTAPSEPLDVWSVGACLYFMLVGAPPVDSGEDLAQRMAQLTAPAAAHSGPDTDDLAAVVRLALAADPRSRYESAYAMLGDVRRLLAGRKPKLDGALAPVPTQSASHRAALPPGSSGMRQLRKTEPEPRERSTREWRGNVVLMIAFALLVALATFVMARERLAEEPTRLTQTGDFMTGRSALAPGYPSPLLI